MAYETLHQDKHQYKYTIGLNFINIKFLQIIRMIFQGPSKSFSLDEEVQLDSKDLLQQSFQSQDTMNSQNESKACKCECQTLLKQLSENVKMLITKSQKFKFQKTNSLIVFFDAIIRTKKQQINDMQESNQKFVDKLIALRNKIKQCEYQQYHQQNLQKLNQKAKLFGQLFRTNTKIVWKTIPEKMSIRQTKISQEQLQLEMELFITQILNSRVFELLLFQKKSNNEILKVQKQFFHLENKYNCLLNYLGAIGKIGTPKIELVTLKFKELSENYKQLKQGETKEQSKFTFGEN